MTLEQYIGNINSACERGIVLDRIPSVNFKELMKEIAADLADDSNGITKSPTNISQEIVSQIQAKLGLNFAGESAIENLCFATNNEELRDEFVLNFSTLDVLDYLYAVLHASAYRKENNDSLKTIPYPTTVSGFRSLIVLGRELRQIHLRENTKVMGCRLEFNIQGDSVINKPHFESQALAVATTGKLWINATQYFDNVPQVAWDFNSGKCQPAQQWLNEREGCKLEFSDIVHYQKIVVALSETDRFIKAIDALV